MTRLPPKKAVNAMTAENCGLESRRRCFLRLLIAERCKQSVFTHVGSTPGGGGTLGIYGWGCAAGTLEPLTYTRASPRVAVSLV